MKKNSLFIKSVGFAGLFCCIALPSFAQSLHNHHHHTIEARQSDKNIYSVIHFEKLPSPELLKNAGVTSLNYIDETSIYASISDLNKLRELEGFVGYEDLNPEYKIAEPIREFVASSSLITKHVFVYLPADFSQEDVNAFLTKNELTQIKSKYVPNYIVITEVSAKQASSLKLLPEVSWIAEAPDVVLKEQAFFWCPGGITPYGPKGEFAKYALVGYGWDGPGLGCSDLTYHFVNGTSDISGSLEHDEVERAIRTWERYAQINFYETPTAGLTNSIDIQWATGDHGDGNPFDGVSGVLAHAFYPGGVIGGDTHFDDAEYWSIGSGKDLYTIALHEIGHALGLAHSTNSSAAMYTPYTSGTVLSDLHADDINGIRAQYAYRNYVEYENDRTFVGNVTGSASKEIVMVNTSYNQGAIRVDDLMTGANTLLLEHCSYQGWMDNTDKVFLADANNDGYEDLILVNTDYVDGAIRAIDLTTGNDLSWIMHGAYGGWMDATDKMFVGDMNNDGKDELILVNTNYSGGAIRAVDMMTGATVSQINHGSFGSWMDASDRMLLGDADGNGEQDLILVNTAYSGGAIRAVDISSGANIAWLNHGAYGGWMDPNDKVSVADINNNGRDELILVNTGYTGGAIRAVEMQTGISLSTLNHTGLYNGWMDNCDQMFTADANNDGEEDIIFVNSSYTGGAFLSVDISSGAVIATLSHTGTYNGWMDSQDRMICNDVNNDGRAEVVLINTGYTGDAVRPLTTSTGASLITIAHTGQFNGWMDGSSEYGNCTNNPVFKSMDEETVMNSVEESTIVVYPNPASNLVNFQLTSVEENASARVIDLNGRTVSSISNLVHGENKVDVSALNSGMYLLEIQNGQQLSRITITIAK